MLFFGFSRTLWWAILGRSLNGLLNGNIGVAKTYLSEVTDDTNRFEKIKTFNIKKIKKFNSKTIAEKLSQLLVFFTFYFLFFILL